MEDEKKWQVCVCAVLKKRNEYLMVKRTSEEEEMAGVWEMPSGKVEYGETVESGLQREVLEEVGVNISQFKKSIIGLSEYRSSKNGVSKYTVQLNYLVDVPDIDLDVKLSDEHTDFVWAPKGSKYMDEFIGEIVDSIEEKKNGRNIEGQEDNCR